MPQKDEKYTRPQLRQRIKDKLMEGDKGGKPGQWSARKSQLLAQEYEKQGGGYNGEKGKAAKNLDKWTEQNWQTKDKSPHARKNGATSRYLPEKAWALLTEADRKKAEATKKKGSKEGEQHIEWPVAVKRAMAEIGAAKGEGLSKEYLEKRAGELGIDGRSGMSKEELVKAITAHKPRKEKAGGGKTKADLYEEAKRQNIEGRSTMTKEQLEKALAKAGK